MPANRNEVASQVRQIIAETLSVPETAIHETTQIVEDLSADSMDIVTLAVTFDDAFDVEFDLSQIPAHRVTVAWVIDYIVARAI